VAGERLALKVLAARLADRSAMGVRMAEEARALGQLRHPNVVALRASGALPDGRPFVAMELLRGRTLDLLTRRGRPLPVLEAVRYVRELLRALGATHDAGLVHCDVKPSNVFVCDDGTVKLIDFGAVERSAPAPARTAVRSDPVLGTPRYMAPERRAGAPATARCDLYAVGLVLEELLAPHEPGACALLSVARKASASRARARFASAQQMERAIRAAERMWCRGTRPSRPGLAARAPIGRGSLSPADPQEALEACSAAFFS
jgi:serine/threonine protein kinase